MVVKVLCFILICALAANIPYNHMNLDYVAYEAKRLAAYDQKFMLQEIKNTKQNVELLK